MKTRYKDLKGKVVVITGASAGVGRATAMAFARAGAQLALLARDPAALEVTKDDIEAAGGVALIFPLDVRNASAVREAAAQCEAVLGPIDVWVNNAMTTVFSKVQDLTEEEVEAVTATTYLGYAYGTMAALSSMRRRDRGVIVQVGSALAYRGIPLQAAYCGAKHAIRGFTDALRTELIAEGSHVRITAVHLPAINTPQFDWARSHRDRLPRPVPPVYRPEVAANAIVKAAQRPEREYWLGISTPFLIIGNALFPGLIDRHLAGEAVSGQDRPRRRPARRRDNLLTPVTGLHGVDGAFGGEAKSGALRVSELPLRSGVAIGSGLVLLAAGTAIGRTLRARRRLQERAHGRS